MLCIRSGLDIGGREVHEKVSCSMCGENLNEFMRTMTAFLSCTMIITCLKNELLFGVLRLGRFVDFLICRGHEHRSRRPRSR